MKRVLFLFILCGLAFGINAQTAKDEIFADVRLSAANHRAYPENDFKQTAPPAGYKPFYLSHYARHGSRYRVNPDDYEKPLAILQEAKKHGVLTELGEKTLMLVDSLSRMAKGRYGELTPLGARQHKGIALRMFQHYPEVFQGKATVDARSTVVIRCILSMTAECEQLQALNPRLNFLNDASSADMYYMNYNDDSFSKERKSKSVLSAKADFWKKHLHPQRLMKSLFRDENYVKWKVDAGMLMSLLFELAANMQSHDTELELYSLFTKKECYEMWLLSNWNWYVAYGSAPLTRGRMPYLEANLLRNILNTADSCIANGTHGATLRFGHESCVLPLACLMELDSCSYATTDYENLANHWRNYRIFPMACNIQLVFYRKKKGDNVLVKVLLNEKEVKLPLESKLTPYYDWKDVEAYYRNKLAGFVKQ